MLNMLFLFANILLRLEMRDRYFQVLTFIADFCCETYNLRPLMKAYLKIAKQLNANKEYEKAAIVLKNTLKISWITNDAKVEI